MKGQAEIVEAVVGGMVILMITGFATSAFWNVFQQTSDDYVEKSKLENAQSKISRLQSTVDSKNQRINTLEDDKSRLQNLLNQWKTNYSKLKKENQNLRERLNQTDKKQKFGAALNIPRINIEHPWGVSLAAILGIVLGAFAPSALLGIDGYFEIPLPGNSEREKRTETDQETEEKEEAEAKDSG